MQMILSKLTLSGQFAYLWSAWLISLILIGLVAGHSYYQRRRIMFALKRQEQLRHLEQTKGVS